MKDALTGLTAGSLNGYCGSKRCSGGGDNLINKNRSTSPPERCRGGENDDEDGCGSAGSHPIHSYSGSGICSGSRGWRGWYTREARKGRYAGHIGEELHDGQYRILYRLGRGGFSDVWLAENRLYETHVPTAGCRYVAIKITTSSSPKDSPEREILNTLKTMSGGDHCHKTSGHIIRLLDEFEVGDGKHHAFVTEVLGTTFHDLPYMFKDDEWVPRNIALNAISELVEAVSYLHSHGIVHGGKYSATRRPNSGSFIHGS